MPKMLEDEYLKSLKEKLIRNPEKKTFIYDVRV
jgi:hypothetical protein